MAVVGAVAFVVPTTAKYFGVDAAADDPNSPLLVTDRGFAAVGRMFAGLDRPLVFVHEGGYVLSTLAEHTLAVLSGFES